MVTCLGEKKTLILNLWETWRGMSDIRLFGSKTHYMISAPTTIPGYGGTSEVIKIICLWNYRRQQNMGLTNGTLPFIWEYLLKLIFLLHSKPAFSMFPVLAESTWWHKCNLRLATTYKQQIIIIRKEAYSIVFSITLRR